MKIIITGSLGHISKPLTEELVHKGHAVTVISSNPEKQKTIEALGATAAIGSVEDLDFLIPTFTGADAVYTMVPPNNYFNPALDLHAYVQKVVNNYAAAVELAGIQRVIHLSSVGAHLEKNSGLIIAHHEAEQILGKLSQVSISFMRPVGFYYNLLGFIPVIKNAGHIAANYGADDMLVWVSPVDIAGAVAEELLTLSPARRNIRYVVSDELTGNETASILGEAIGIPDLKWLLIDSEAWQKNLTAAGMTPNIAAGLVEMFEAQHNGLLTEDYYRNKPTIVGKVKLSDFAKEFATAFK